MAVRETLARFFGAKASIIGLSADELPDRALEKSYDDAALLSTYADDAWPYILANKIGEQASQAPLQVGTVDKDDEFKPVSKDHPVQALFDNPNPLYDGGEFVHLLMLYMELAGHSPIEFVQPLGGGIIGAPGRRGVRFMVLASVAWSSPIDPIAALAWGAKMRARFSGPAALTSRSS